MIKIISHKNSSILLIMSFLTSIGIGGCAEAELRTTEGQKISKASSMESAAGETSTSDSKGLSYCGGGKPIAVPMQTNKLDVPVYNNTSSFT